MTEDQIERAAERKFDMLDRRLMAGDLSQSDYDDLAKQISKWAEIEYRSGYALFQCRWESR